MYCVAGLRREVDMTVEGYFVRTGTDLSGRSKLLAVFCKLIVVRQLGHGCCMLFVDKKT